MKKIAIALPSRFLVLSFLLFVTAAPALAHVNSPDVYFDGWAGPYHLLVTVRPPPVIPGVAEIEIRSDSPDLRELRLVPMRITGPGAELAPVPDLAARSKSDPQLFTGQLWIMLRGSWKIRILADGAKGKGELGVPAPAVSRMSLPMERALSALLIALGLLLAAGLVNIIGAGAGEATTEPGQEISAAKKRRARLMMAFGVAFLAAAFYFGGRWWDAKAADVRHSNYEVPRVTASLENGSRLMLRLSNPNAEWSEAVRLDDLIPDHSHLMHLFLVRTPELDRFWHLHPDEVEPGVFAVDLPRISAGHYQIFADIVHHTGFPETQVGEISLPDVAGRALAGDDSTGDAPPITAAVSAHTAAHEDAGTVAALAGGARMIWERPAGALKTRQPIWFRFRVEDARGKPATDLEPYMGMPGHAFFLRSDLGVFAHVHPAGSVSMAALELAQPGGDQMPGMMHTTIAADTGATERVSSEVSFPYGFPEPGVYRLFVQVKQAGRIETGVFDARVEK
jgi:hypothetical protein